MHANSREVSSNQPHTHPRLASTVRKHLATELRRPIPSHNREAYETLREHLGERPLVLDSFCGTGQSTAILTDQFQDCLVVGIDKSGQRLSKRPRGTGDNCLFLRADCEDIWTQLVAGGITVHRHYLLYPNPWPKRAHLKRRIHGHPGFRALLQLGGKLELRSNWQLYVEEFGLAMHLAGVRGLVQRVDAGRQDLTLFEQKYRRSGHDLWRYLGTIAP